MKHEDGPRYRNLDTEIYSREDLAPLADHFAPFTDILYSGAWGEGRFCLSMEPPIRIHRKATPERDLKYFLDLLDGIPPELQPLWKRRNRLTFDFGMEGGLWAPRPNGSINALFFEFTPKSLVRVAAHRGRLAFTLYPVDPEPSPAPVE